MDARTLLIHRWESLSALTHSHREIDVVETSRLIYQIVQDKHPLMVTANPSKLPIVFRMVVPPAPPDWLQALLTDGMRSLVDGFDPDLAAGSPMEQHIKDLSRDDFLNVEIMWLQGVPIRVKHCVGYARNVEGGGHHDPSAVSGEYASIKAYNDYLKVDGMPVATRTLKALGLVTLRALQPLCEQLRSEGFAA